MSASDHLQPHQLAMFMSASELYGGNLGDLRGQQQTEANKSALMGKKLKRVAKGATKAGEHMDEPVLMWHGLSLHTDKADPGRSELGEGHHRLAIQLARDPKGLLPVQHQGSEGLNTTPKAWWDI